MLSCLALATPSSAAECGQWLIMEAGRKRYKTTYMTNLKWYFLPPKLPSLIYPAQPFIYSPNIYSVQQTYIKHLMSAGHRARHTKWVRNGPYSQHAHSWVELTSNKITAIIQCGQGAYRTLWELLAGRWECQYGILRRKNCLCEGFQKWEKTNIERQ